MLWESMSGGGLVLWESMSGEGLGMGFIYAI